MAAYEDAIRATSRDEAPWYVVPADNKPFARLVVARAIVDALSRLDLKYPKVDAAALKEMQKIKATLLEEGPSKRIESSQLRPNYFMGGGPLERRGGACPPPRRQLASQAHLPLQDRRSYIVLNAEFIVFRDYQGQDRRPAPSDVEGSDADLPR